MIHRKQLSCLVRAPAKINLALAVTNKRPDGMHDLQTIFQTVSLYDTIHLSLTGKEIICHCGELSGERNLAFKAASLFLERYRQFYPHDSRTGVEISIDKKIPQQAGLAGGSSDAAAVLKALNDLYGNPFSYPELLAMARKCGADTAFFLKGGTQWGEGTGSLLTEFPPAPELTLIIAKPERGVDTAQAYQIFDEIGSYGSLSPDSWRELLLGQDRQAIGQHLFNSLEAAAFQLVPEIKQLKLLLQQTGCLGALMSGSGSAVFGILHDEAQGRQIAAQLDAAGFRNHWIVKTIASTEIR